MQWLVQQVGSVEYLPRFSTLRFGTTGWEWGSDLTVVF